MFGDPFNIVGLVINKTMHTGVTFEVYDLFEDKRLQVDVPLARRRRKPDRHDRWQ